MGSRSVPDNGELGIVLRGDLAAMLSFAGSKKPGAVSGAEPQALAVQASLMVWTAPSIGA